MLKLSFTALGLLLTLATTTATASVGCERPVYSVEEEVRQLVGLWYLRAGGGALFGAPIRPEFSCVYRGGGTLGTSVTGQSVSRSVLECQGRQVLIIETLEQRLDDRTHIYKITDALLLPPLEESRDGNALVMMDLGTCEIDGEFGQHRYESLGRWKGREVIDGHDGIEHAWLLDYEHTGKFIPLDINRIICHRPDEP